MSEHSPLLSPTHPENGRPSTQYSGPPLPEPESFSEPESRSVWYLILLTIGIGG